MSRINLSSLQPMMCMAQDTPEERMRLGKDALPIQTADGDMLFDRGRIEIVRPYGNERVYNACVRFVGLLSVDRPQLERRGCTAPWLADFISNKDVFYTHLDEELAEREAGAAARMFSVASALPGAQVARQVVTLAQGHWLEELLGVGLSSLQTLDGLHAGLRKINGRLRNPLVEERVLATGITAAELQQMREAQAALHRMIDEGRIAEAVAAVGPTPLLVMRAILWAEMSLVGAAARTELPEERWRQYVGQSLLELPARGPERRERPAPEPTPAPADHTGAQPGGSAPAAPGRPGAEGQPAAGVQPGAATPGAAAPLPPPAVQPGVGAASPSVPQPGAGAASPSAARSAAGPPPGTTLYAVPPGGSRPLPVQLLPDGSLAWLAAPADSRIDAPQERAARRPRPRRR